MAANQKTPQPKTKDYARILEAYKLKADEIIRKMLQVLMQSQKKVDDIAYREALQKIEQLKQKS